jgi:hypothetical protein
MSNFNIWAFIDKMTYRELKDFADTIVTATDGEMPSDGPIVCGVDAFD